MLNYIGETLIVFVLQGLLADSINTAAETSTLIKNISILTASEYHNWRLPKNVLYLSKNAPENQIQFLQEPGPDMETTTTTPSVISNTNFTTPSPHLPSATVEKKRNIKNILLYTFIPLGLLVIGLIVVFLVIYVRKYRRKRRLQRELLPEYSFYSSEVDLTEALVDETDNLDADCFHYHHGAANKSQEMDSFEQPRLTINIPKSPKLVVQTVPYSSPSDEEATFVT